MSTVGTTLAALPDAATGTIGGLAPACRPRISAGGAAGLRRLACSACSPAARPARIAAMLIAIIAMSLADLYMTLAHLIHFGMIEVNPIARRIMETGTPAQLITWKLTSVLVTVTILFAFRRRCAAEAGALACFLVMAWLTAHWFNYNDSVSAMTQELHTLATVPDHGFVSMPAGRDD